MTNPFEEYLDKEFVRAIADAQTEEYDIHEWREAFTIVNQDSKWKK